MQRTLLLAASVLLAATLAPALGSAQGMANPTDEDLTRAIELYDNGAILYEEGRYEEALVAWTEAYRISGEPLLLYNMVNAHERIGNLEEALDALNVYRAYASSDEREVLERRIRNLERRLEQRRAEEERIRLAEEALAAQEEADANPEETETTPDPVVVVEPEETRMPRRPLNGTERIIRYSGLGLAAVGFGLGAGFGLQAESERSSALDYCLDGADGYCQPGAAEHLDAAKSNALIADVGFGLGVIGVGAVISTFFRPRLEPGEADVAVVPALSTDHVGIQVGGRF